jgi:peptidylprolyl isomerase
MANKGPDTNENAFFITLSPAEWFDHKHVAFGRVTDGLEILAEIEK